MESNKNMATDQRPADHIFAESLGEHRVRTTFNPSDDSIIQHIKERGAEFINYIDQQVNTPNSSLSTGEFHRLKALAMTSIEEGTSWAVKAQTWQPRK